MLGECVTDERAAGGIRSAGEGERGEAAGDGQDGGQRRGGAQAERPGPAGGRGEPGRGGVLAGGGVACRRRSGDLVRAGAGGSCRVFRRGRGGLRYLSGAGLPAAGRRVYCHQVCRRIRQAGCGRHGRLRCGEPGWQCGVSGPGPGRRLAAGRRAARSGRCGRSGAVLFSGLPGSPGRGLAATAGGAGRGGGGRCSPGQRPGDRAGRGGRRAGRTGGCRIGGKRRILGAGAGRRGDLGCRVPSRQLARRGGTGTGMIRRHAQRVPQRVSEVPAGGIPVLRGLRQRPGEHRVGRRRNPRPP